MTLAIAALVLGQYHSPQLKTILPSGAVILAESMPGAKSVSVQLFASARGVQESAERHGWRHLLEHLILKGRDPKNPIDTRAESKGLFLTGRTYRDAMQIEVTAPAGREKEAFDLIREVTLPLKLTQAEIDAEVKVLDEELALTEDAVRLGQGAWNEAYGAAGLDAQGSLDAVAKATPDGLADLLSKHFSPKNLVLVVSGPIQVDDATAQASALLAGFREDPGESLDRPEGRSGRVAVDGAFGEGRAVAVGPFGTPETAAILTAAFGIAARHPGAFVTYTPTMSRGLVLVGQTDSNSGIGIAIDEFNQGDWGQIYTVGLNLARRWLANYLATPSGSAYLWGSILLDRPTAKLDDVKAGFANLSFGTFMTEVKRFDKDRAVVFVGAGR